MGRVNLSSTGNTKAYTLTKYIESFQEEIGRMSQEDLIEKFNEAIEKGVNISIDKLDQMISNIVNSPGIIEAQKYVYNILLVGAGLGVQSEVSNNFYIPTDGDNRLDRKVGRSA
jgi:hypothetical protein